MLERVSYSMECEIPSQHSRRAYMMISAFRLSIKRMS